MTMKRPGANVYRQTQVKTATPGQILILLYEAAIKHTKLAMQAIQKKDLPAKGVAIGKTHDILNELSLSLNFEVGGKVAKDLESLYHFMTRQLVKANLENSVKDLESVVKCLETLLSAWRVAVAETQKQGNTPQGGSSESK